MTSRRTPITAALAATAIAVGALFAGTTGAGADGAASGANAGAAYGASAGAAAYAAGADGAASAAAPARYALVIDSSLARDGRELVDARLADADAEVRVPRTPTEARTNVRYFDKLGYTVVVAGTDATAAAEGIGEPAVYTAGLDAALAAAR
jgi:hypothetical protein